MVPHPHPPADLATTVASVSDPPGLTTAAPSPPTDIAINVASIPDPPVPTRIQFMRKHTETMGNRK